MDKPKKKNPRIEVVLSKAEAFVMSPKKKYLIQIELPEESSREQVQGLQAGFTRELARIGIRPENYTIIVTNQVNIKVTEAEGKKGMSPQEHGKKMAEAEAKEAPAEEKADETQA